jgi:hypothetical protein
MSESTPCLISKWSKRTVVPLIIIIPVSSSDALEGILIVEWNLIVINPSFVIEAMYAMGLFV